MPNETVRVLRVLEFSGPRQAVERQIAHSVSGIRRIRDPQNAAGWVLRAATVSEEHKEAVLAALEEGLNALSRNPTALSHWPPEPPSHWPKEDDQVKEAAE